jgi:sortase A
MPVVEGVTDDNLASGLAHFADSAAPGQVGNFALAGHRITHGQPLHDMPDLEPGDQVVVETREVVYTYEIDTDPEDLVVTDTDTWVVDRHPVNPDSDGIQPATDQRLLTLTTCAELFHTDDRMVLFGHLTGARQK